jgi:hypothetical protein
VRHLLNQLDDRRLFDVVLLLNVHRDLEQPVPVALRLVPARAEADVRVAAQIFDFAAPLLEQDVAAEERLVEAP